MLPRLKWVATSVVVAVVVGCVTETLSPGKIDNFGRPSLSIALDPVGLCFYSSFNSRNGSNNATKILAQGTTTCMPVTDEPDRLFYHNGNPNLTTGEVVQTAPIALTLGAPGYSASVIVSGMLVCSGLGSNVVKFYNGTTLVATVPFSVSCGPDGTANGGTAQPSYVGKVTRVVIEPPSAWSTLVPDCCGGTTTAYHTVEYTVQFYDIDPCPVAVQQPVDSLFNREIVRRAMRMALDSSPPTGSAWNRRERGVIGMLQDDGSIKNYLMPIKPIDAPCYFIWPVPFPIDSYPGFPLYRIHSHPFSPNDKLDPLPYDRNLVPRSNCDTLAQLSLPAGAVVTAAAGPSPRDSMAVGEGLPELIIDPKGMYLLERRQDGTLYERDVKRTSSCDPLNRISPN